MRGSRRLFDVPTKPGNDGVRDMPCCAKVQSYYTISTAPRTYPACHANGMQNMAPLLPPGAFWLPSYKRSACCRGAGSTHIGRICRDGGVFWYHLPRLAYAPRPTHRRARSVPFNSIGRCTKRSSLHTCIIRSHRTFGNASRTGLSDVRPRTNGGSPLKVLLSSTCSLGIDVAALSRSHDTQFPYHSEA